MRAKNVLLIVAMLVLCSGCPESVTPDQVDRLTGNVQDVMLAIKDSKSGLDTLVAANNASAPINPYYPIIAAGLSMVGLIKRDLDARKAGKKYKAHKQGAEKFMRTADNPEKLYEAIGEARARNGIT